MSNKLPFDDAFKNKLNDLPSANEDIAWQKMKQLLEEKEERKPFAWLNFYTVCSCIIIFAGLGIWMIISNNKQNIRKTEINSVKAINKSSDQQSKSKGNTTAVKQAESNKILTQKNNADTFSKQTATTIIELNATKHKHLSLIINNKLKNFNNQLSVGRNQVSNINSRRNSNDFSTIEKENNNILAIGNSDSLQNVNNNKQSISQSNTISKIIEPSFSEIEKNDSVETKTNTLNNLKHSLNFDSGSAKNQIPISLKQRLFFVEAGVQIKQQLPLNGQKIIAYNYSGNKALFKDYIPSMFINFEKNNQWFFQAEFSYATPYLIKQFSYSRQTKVDYTISSVTITSNNLQKTYYTELPLSFNYYVSPNWFIGTGTLYGWFHGAVTQQQVITNNIKAGTFTTTKKMIPFKIFTDSFLYKNQANLLLQTGYSLKRWSFVLRYEKGVHPYIKYTLPNGAIESKRNSSIELNIGYRFIKTPF